MYELKQGGKVHFSNDQKWIHQWLWTYDEILDKIVRQGGVYFVQGFGLIIFGKIGTNCELLSKLPYYNCTIWCAIARVVEKPQNYLATMLSMD